MKLIAFTGAMGSGKSTAIECIKELSIYSPIQLIKFAQPLYDIQQFIYDQVSPVYTPPSNFIKDRKLLQWLGTEWGRSIDQNLWVKLWVADVKSYASLRAEYVIVCDDCRFDNEAEAVKSLGGTIIKINSNKNHLRIDTAQGISNHISESGLSPGLIDATIDNDGTVEDLKNKLIELNKTYDLF